jgi:DNA damage-inducible protein 1
MTLETLRSSIQAETRIDPNTQHLYHNGQLITDNTKTLQELHIGDGEMLALHVREMRGITGPPPAASNRQAQRPPPPARDPEMIRLQVLGNPTLRAELARSQPELAAVENPQRFAQLFTENFDRERRERVERQREIQRLNADMFDIEAQTKIAEMIRQERVIENLQNALEHNPEGEYSLHRGSVVTRGGKAVS